MDDVVKQIKKKWKNKEEITKVGLELCVVLTATRYSLFNFILKEKNEFYTDSVKDTWIINFVFEVEEGINIILLEKGILESLWERHSKYI